MAIAKEIIDPPMNSQWAYILGLVAADGCITDTGEFTLGLKIEDKYLIESIEKYLSQYLNVKQANTDNRSNVYRIRVHSVKFRDLLISKYKITPRKSLTLEWPDYIPGNLLHHYIRGYLDGDGCISLHDKRLQIIFESSEKFLKSLDYFLSQTFKLPSQSVRKHSTGNIFVLCYSGLDASQILDYIYLDKEKSFYLFRKWNKYLETKNISFKKVRYWKDFEDKILINNYQQNNFKDTLEKTSSILNRGKSSVQNRLAQLRKAGKC